jgi:3-hydroxyacyl-CoA dehydrogenase
MPVGDPALTATATELAAKHGIARRRAVDIGNDEIVERLLYPLINEGLKILQEGIAYRPGDIDVVWVAGCGFPDYRGGPMWMADSIGAPRIAERLAFYAATRGNEFGYWIPAQLLTDLAASGKPLAPSAARTRVAPSSP